MEEKQYKDYAGAVFLIFLGAIFLLNTTGVVGWGVWLYVIRFWPLLIIMAGIKIMLPKNNVTNIIIAVIQLIALVFVGLSSYYYSIGKSVPVFSNSFSNCLFNNCEYVNDISYKQDSSDVTVTEYPEVQEKVLNLDIAATKLTVDDAESENYLHTESSYYSNQYKPTIETTLKDGVLTTTFDNTKIQYYSGWMHRTPEYKLTIGQIEIPSSIDLELGAGQTDIDLSKTAMKSITASVGAGDLNISLSGNSIPQDMNLKIGAGDVSITIPKDIGVKVKYSLGLGEIDLDGNEVAGIGSDKEYTTANYNDAVQKIDIVASVGVGRLSIERN